MNTAANSEILVPGYSLQEQLYCNTKTIVYRAVRETDQCSVVIKFFIKRNGVFSDLLQFRNQFAIAGNIQQSGIIHLYGLEEYDNSYALIMEDFGAISLEQWMEERQGRRKSSQFLSDFLDIAIQLAQILDQLYSHRIIHRNLKPTNILINSETRQVKLTDFSLASLLPRETQEIQNFNTLEGTLAYISPEQTGRMNRGVDYRTDFYSLGVTFYKLLTGQLPFESTDPMELVHSHLAKAPPVAQDLNPAIPLVLSEIVGKLMSKNAEDRYQSAQGLKHDLEICRTQFEATGAIAPFEVGQRDVSDRFLIPEKLYGRELEVKTLLDAFERTAQGHSELMLVTGFSGIGKTAIVNEVHKPIVRQRAYFIKGKFDQLNRNIPFSAFLQAFRDLMGQLLGETNAQLAQWKTNILQAVGESGQVIIEVIPELERIIGEQPAAPELAGSESQNRFNLLFRQFIQVFTTPEHPLVMFLDDLQWADAASLALLKLLISETAGYLLVIGAYRDNEVSPVHPLMLTLDEIRKANATINSLTLSPLLEKDANQLIADTFCCSSVLTQTLMELVHQKTQGNPFFMIQFLKALHKNNCITFNKQECHWECDISQVRSLALTDDVVEFMAVQLQKLQPETQSMLKLAACIGNRFDLATLAIVAEKSQTATATDLWKALQEGLISPTSEVYKLFQNSAVKNQESKIAENAAVGWLPLSPFSYKFLHDRVQQAAYSLIAEDQKQATHLHIGTLLLCNTSDSEREERIFEIVNHLNVGSALITSSSKREELIRLNLTAARKAKASTAYRTATEYLTTGIRLLPVDAWEQRYELTLALHQEMTEVAYLNTDFDQVEQWSELVLQHSRNLLDTVKIYEAKLLTARAQGNYLAAVRIGLQVLRSFGIEFSEQPTPTEIKQAFETTRHLWQGRSPLGLLNLPPMSDRNHLAAMQIMTKLTAPAYRAVPTLMPLLVCKQVELSIQSGNGLISIFSYAGYGMSFCSMGEIEAGYEFGQLSLSLLEQLQAGPCKSRAGYLISNFVRHWKEPLREVLPSFIEAYQSGLATGDLECVALNAQAYCHYSYFAGKGLAELAQEMQSYRQALRQLKQVTLKCLEIVQQTVFNLLGESGAPWQLTGSVYNAEQSLPQHQAIGDRTALFHFHHNQTFLYYLFEQYSQAVQESALAEQYLDGGRAQFPVVLHFFYDALLHLAVYRTATTEQQTQIWERVQGHQDKLRHWAASAPLNHQHRWELVEAERLAILGKQPAAMDLYDCAIAGAKTNGFIQDESLANELAAKFYLQWGKEKVAQAYLQEAYHGYARWGAQAKIEDLEQRYPKLLQPILSKKRTHSYSQSNVVSRPESTHTSNGSTEFLDLATVIKSSQAISGQLLPDQLIVTLMQYVLENAGAERGALILLQSDQLVVVAQCISGQDCTLYATPLDTSSELPVSLVHYAFRTAEAFVTDDIKIENQFAADPYIVQQQPTSVLCLPLIQTKQPIGVLYLENNLMVGAFTGDRINVLNVLCAQAAISFENANLYKNLQASNQTLQQSLEALQHTQTRLMQATEKLQHDAFHDALTGLPNRALFTQLLEHAIQLAQRQSNSLYAVLFIDLDRFKMINDSLGHALGDELLKCVAQRLQTCVNPSDTVARFGGDEFAILLEELREADEAIAIANRIHEQFLLPLNIAGYEMFTAASIGIALSTLNYRDASHVLRDADTAMYHAKSQGRNCYAIFDPDMQTRITARLQLESSLRRAIEAKELSLYYQPILSLSTGRLRGFEALVRWCHPERGMISPVEFIPVAEESGLIIPLGWWVLQEACYQLSQWLLLFPNASPLVMNVNFSAIQLKQTELLERLEKILQETGIPRDCLKLEITESCILETFTSEAQRLKQLKDLGIGLCIDDFGTGYSSLSRLHEFPIDTLKIDQSFVRHLSANSRETVRMIVTLAHSLEMDVVAEGIETRDELETLRELGCEFGQGYLFSPPIEQQMVSEWLRNTGGDRPKTYPQEKLYNSLLD